MHLDRSTGIDAGEAQTPAQSEATKVLPAWRGCRSVRGIRLRQAV